MERRICTAVLECWCDMFCTVAALHCVICLSCYNDSIICCCLGNRRICSATQMPAMYRCVCCSVWTGECECGSVEKVTLFNESQNRKKGLLTQILYNMVCVCEYVCVWAITFDKTMQTPREQTRKHVTCFQSVFSCKLWWSSFSSLQVANVFAIGKSLKITYRQNFVTILWWASSISLHTFAPALAWTTTWISMSWNRSILHSYTSRPHLLHTCHIFFFEKKLQHQSTTRWHR